MSTATETKPAAAKHTPGPWKVIADPIKAGIHPYHDHRFVGTVDADFDADGTQCGGHILAKLTDAPEIIANARLIAASPDLLAAYPALIEIAREYRELIVGSESRDGDESTMDADAKGDVARIDSALAPATAAIAKAGGAA